MYLLSLCVAVLLLNGARSQIHEIGFFGNPEHASGSGEMEGSGFDGSGERDRVCERLDCIRTEECKEMNGRFGCACKEHHHRRHESDSGSDFDAHTKCESSSGSVSLSRCQLFEAGVPERLLHLNDKNCKGHIDNGRVDFRFDDHHECGTTLETNGTHFVYKNSIQMKHAYELVSRDSWLSINFSCYYPLIKTVSLPRAIQADPSVISKNLPGTEGTYDIKMMIYKDPSFRDPYRGKVHLKVNHLIYVAVQVEKVDKHQFSLVLDNCWATPYPNRDYPIRWNLIEHDCPNPHDLTVKVLENGESLTARFSFRMFTFTKLSDTIYLHCKTNLCLRRGGHCKRHCDDEDSHEDDHHHGHGHRGRRSVDFHDTAAISMRF